MPHEQSKAPATIDELQHEDMVLNFSPRLLSQACGGSGGLFEVLLENHKSVWLVRTVVKPEVLGEEGF